MNFEHYLDHNRLNPKRAAMLTVAAAFALTGTSMMLTAGWVAGKLTIARVDPPSTEYILLQMAMEEPPPPPPPPPPPLGSTDAEEEKPETDDEVPEEPEDLEEVQPDKTPNKIPDKTSVGSPQGVPDGVLGGQLGGIPGGIPGPPVVIGTHTIAVKPPKKESVTKMPLEAVMARATYSPDPSQQLLQQTKAARFDKRDGKVTIAFCIDNNGRVVDLKTKTKFPGDPQVDDIVRAAIASWRFKPLEVGSKKLKTCTERTFSIKFK